MDYLVNALESLSPLALEEQAYIQGLPVDSTVDEILDDIMSRFTVTLSPPFLYELVMGVSDAAQRGVLDGESLLELPLSILLPLAYVFEYDHGGRMDSTLLAEGIFEMALNNPIPNIEQWTMFQNANFD